VAADVVESAGRSVDIGTAVHHRQMVSNWKVAPAFRASCASSGDWLSGW
jgi:hypothetical protein